MQDLAAEAQAIEGQEAEQRLHDQVKFLLIFNIHEGLTLFFQSKHMAHWRSQEVEQRIQNQVKQHF